MIRIQGVRMNSNSAWSWTRVLLLVCLALGCSSDGGGSLARLRAILPEDAATVELAEVATEFPGPILLEPHGKPAAHRGPAALFASRRTCSHVAGTKPPPSPSGIPSLVLYEDDAGTPGDPSPCLRHANRAECIAPTCG